MIAQEYGYDDLPDEISRKQLLRILKMHDTDASEFDAEIATAETYESDKVLEWLGY